MTNNKSNYYTSKRYQEEEIEKLRAKNEKISQILEKIKSKEEPENKIFFYKEILKLNNVSEKYVLEYLLSNKESIEKGKIDSKILMESLEKYQTRLSDNNYNKYFKDYPRINSRTKIKQYLEFLINSKDIINPEGKVKFISKIYKFIQSENKIDINVNQQVKWENNEELFLYTLYQYLLSSMIFMMSYYINNDSEKKNAITNERYILIQSLIEKEKNLINEENKKEKKDADLEKERNEKKEFLKRTQEYIILLNGKFFDDYIQYLLLFLSHIDYYYNQRFNNLEFKDQNDRIIFEHYIQFIGSYLFNKDNGYLYYKWKEIFVPLNKDQKEEILNNFNLKDNMIKISFCDKSNNTLQLENTFTKKKVLLYA